MFLFTLKPRNGSLNRTGTPMRSSSNDAQAGELGAAAAQKNHFKTVAIVRRHGAVETHRPPDLFG